MKLRAVLAACGGFLLAVLWFDLMFDIQVLRHAPAPAPLPEATLTSIARYYARVTTDAHPMQRLIALVMATTVLGSAWSVWTTPRRILPWVACLSATVPIGLAAARAFPNAVRLGAGTASLAEQSALARAIFADHVICLPAIVAFTVLQIVLLTQRPSHAPRTPPAAAPR
jgi:hypothetical protein